MVSRLQYEEGKDVRAVLDNTLDVRQWITPLVHSQRAPVSAVDVPDAVPPSWWRGDEAESQTFLAAMGVKVDG